MTSDIRQTHLPLKQLREQYPNTPFLGLGQTVFWDEPVKAALRLLLDSYALGGEIVAGPHDTDYFAKAKLATRAQARFALTPHNDGTTRDLWSAAGEISTLFGSETFPRKQDFARYGVAFERSARNSELSRQGFLDAKTEAWGWRGVVYTGSRDLVVNSLTLREVGDSILQALSWGFENALVQIAPSCCHNEAHQIAERILKWCRDYCNANPDNSLSDLFQDTLPRFYELLLGRPAENLTVTCTSDLLRLTPETANAPRFRFVDLFIRPETRALAIEAYNQAVAGSEIYTLDKFGAHALPFDIIVQGRGRGTLRLHPRALFIETRQPIAIGLKKPIESLQELAEILDAKLKVPVTLVGKAVTLVSMLAQEFIFVFHEEGSLYVWRTRKMNDFLRAHGVELDMRPILRMRYHTWDALHVATSMFRLPEHLASVFGRPAIAAPDFAATWRSVLEEQKAFCQKSAELKKPLDLLAYLEAREPHNAWDERKAEYLAAKKQIAAQAQERNAIQTQIRALYEALNSQRQAHQILQHAKGDHFRSISEWTEEATAQRAAFEAQEQALQETKTQLRRQIRTLKAQRWDIERGEKANQARETLNRIENEAELTRLNLVRNAILAIEGLPHTAHRPSAWWLPMVDHTGAWFREIAKTTELYLEPLLS